MDIGPIFFKEILFFDFLEESTPILIWAVVRIQEGRSRNKIFPSQSRPNVHFAEVHIPRTDGPTRPTQRLPVRGKVRPFPHPEPPLLFVFTAMPVARWRRNNDASAHANLGPDNCSRGT
jgi:hypothetical protein